jgi:pimeloyl-ACP methyl ester carboxylesterase
LGAVENEMFPPNGSGGIFWQKYNLSTQVMGDGNWHQFIATSNGQDVSVYLDGQDMANGTLNNTINYQDRAIRYLWFSGMGQKSFDEIVFWDKYITPSDAELIYNNGSIATIPSLSNLGQFKSDGTTVIAEGSTITGSMIIFQAMLNNSANNSTQLQIEVKPSNVAFIGSSTANSAFFPALGIVSVPVQNLANGQYHWQARAIDSQGNVSPWQTMSESVTGTDFIIARRYPVILIPGLLGSQKVLGVWEMDPILHSYDNLIEALKLSGYKEDKTLFTFPYDWRQSNASSSLLLKQKIDEAKTTCSAANLAGYDCSKVDLVAHSMGGLVGRAYAESDNYQNDIDQMIFLATPQQGSPMAYLGWEGGSMGKTTQDKFINIILGLQATYHKFGSVFDYVRNFPIQSVQELLPIYNYLQDKGSADYRIYPNNYLVNTFLENLNAPVNLDKLSSLKITNILADAGVNNTINGLRLVNQNFSNGQWANGYPEGYNNLFGDFGLIMGAGDDTVPKVSNSNFLGQSDVVIENSSHMDIPTDAQKEVIKDLTGIEPTIKVNYYPAIEAMKNFLIFAIFSPADFVVTSPDGQQLGKDFANNTEINQIPNAYYSGSTDDPEFVVIPNPVDGQYKVKLQGKDGGGSYHVQASYIGESMTTVKDFSANIAQGQNQTFNLDCASNSPQSVVNLAPQDTVPPTIVINIPTSSVKYFHSDKLKINYIASDDFSGVASATVSIDENVLSTTTIDLFNYTLGVHQISIKAADKAGNQAIKTVNFEIVANIDSSISDINTVYAKKWLGNGADKNALVLSLSALKLGLNLLAIEKAALEKLINDTQNNSKLSAAAKKKIIDPLNKLLTANSNVRLLLIKNSLSDLQKSLDKIKAKNGINQSGYDIIKADIYYLKNNL